MNEKKFKEKIKNSALNFNEEELKHLIEEQSDAGPSVITTLLEIMKDISNRFVLPASYLFCRDEEGWAYWDLDKLAGYTYPGLVSDILKLKYPVLSILPPDEQLERELELAGFQISSAKQRSEFFKGWMATRADRYLQIIVEFLNIIDVAYEKSQLDMLEELVLSDMSGSIRSTLAKLLKKISPKHAHAIETIIKENYLQELLTED